MLRTAVLPLIALAIASPALWGVSWFYRLATLGQLACYGLAAAGLALSKQPIGRLPALAVPGYFTLVNIASLQALLNLVRGERIDRWVPRRTTELTRSAMRLLPEPTDDVLESPTSGDGEAIA
jgi:hypothetical protein